MSSASKDGVFNPACYIHTAFTNNITIQGLNYKQVRRRNAFSYPSPGIAEGPRFLFFWLSIFISAKQM